MKKLLGISLAIIAPLYCFSPTPIIEADNIFARSFMFTRPVYRNLAAQQHLWHDMVFHECDPHSTRFQVIPLYQNSIHSKRIDRYFLFNHKNVLTVKGDAVIAGNPALRDIRAEWLNLPSNFMGNFTVRPKQRQFSVWFEAQQDLGPLICSSFFENLWVGVALPFQFVENDIQLTQIAQSMNTSTHFPTNIIEALNQPSWKYAKFNGKQKAAALAEIMLKLGARFLDRDGFQIGAYSGLVLPLHKGQNPEYIFSPFIGNDTHFGYATGVIFQIPLICGAAYADYINFFANIESIYFFRNTQHRTMDLAYRPWTRYLLFNSIEGTINIPGANVLTQKVRVRPYNMIDLSTGIRLELNNFELEIGYDLWARGREKIKFTDDFPYGKFGIAGDGTLVPGTNIAATASKSTIAQQAPNDVDLDGNPIFIPITKEDILTMSGGAKAAINHRGHFALGYRKAYCLVDAFIGAGGFFEYAQKNTALDTWGLWAKITIDL